MCPGISQPVVSGLDQVSYAAGLLTLAVEAHLAGDGGVAAQLIAAADLPALRQRLRRRASAPGSALRLRRSSGLVITASGALADAGHALRRAERHHCRLCGIPLIRGAVRHRLSEIYPQSLPWGRDEGRCHAAFLLMWRHHVTQPTVAGEGAPVFACCLPCSDDHDALLAVRGRLGEPRHRACAKVGWDGLERALTTPVMGA